MVHHLTHVGISAVFERNRETIGVVSDDYAGQLGWKLRFEGPRLSKEYVESDGCADFRPERGGLE